jgi:hypothetical protein
MKKSILYLLIVLTLFSCNNGEKEIIIVPKNFKGYILVIFDQKDGEPKSYHEGSRIYKIPQNGVLKSQFSGNYGSVGIPEYYYQAINVDSKLPSYLEEKKIPPNKIVGMMGPNGNANKDLEGNERIPFTLFYVGTKSEIEQFKEQADKLDIVKLAE